MKIYTIISLNLSVVLKRSHSTPLSQKYINPNSLDSTLVNTLPFQNATALLLYYLQNHISANRQHLHVEFYCDFLDIRNTFSSYCKTKAELPDLGSKFCRFDLLKITEWNANLRGKFGRADVNLRRFCQNCEKRLVKLRNEKCVICNFEKVVKPG